MSTTDQALLSYIQGKLSEPEDGGVSWASDHWTASEVIALVNQRQHRFLRETGLVFSIALMPTIPMQERHPIPDDWIAIERVVWVRLDNSIKPLERAESWGIDHEARRPIAGSLSEPRVWAHDLTPLNLIQTAPLASDAGQLEFLYLAAADPVDGTGQILILPDEYAAATLAYGVMADMLSKNGRGADPTRAAYCEQRWDLGVATAVLRLDGWSA